MRSIFKYLIEQEQLPQPPEKPKTPLELLQAENQSKREKIDDIHSQLDFRRSIRNVASIYASPHLKGVGMTAMASMAPVKR